MKQVWQIFRKDLRHHWRESLVSIALMAAYAWYEPRSWGPDRLMAYGVSGLGFLSRTFLSELVVILLPISWAFVIVRVIQGESLVGDRQFWVTRPYDWKQLLMAKALFMLAVIHLPLLIADIYLLVRAGFPPTHYVLGLAWMQLGIAVLPVLIVAVLAAVTASVVQMGLALLVIVLYTIGMVELADHIPSSSFSSSFVESVQGYLLIATCVAVILCQYSRRRASLSRWLLVGFAAFVLIVLVASPYETIVARAYPLETGEPPVQLTLQPPEKASEQKVPENEDEVQIQFPLSVAGVSEDSIITMSGMRVELESPNGLRWDSGWRLNVTSLFPERKRAQIDFSLERKFFQRVQDQPVQVRVSLALTVSRDRNRREFIVPEGEFAMPEVGICSWETKYSRNIYCRAPLRMPSSLLVTADLSQTTCPAGEGEVLAPRGELARDWYPHSDSGPAEFGISPVKLVTFSVSASNPLDSRTVTGICPGTRLVLSNPEPVRATRIDLEFREVRLTEYRLRGWSATRWR